MADHQASSSSWSYEVFLSFSGTDVRKNFGDHLYNALVNAGIRTFRDEDELPKGNEIGPELLAAIKQSRISIPIFSENYATSKWCLDELAWISECIRTTDHIALPIFYKIEPRDVRHQTGTYAKAFEEHQMRFNGTRVQNWKEALKEVGKLKGWHADEQTTFEGKLTKEIVNVVWRTLHKGPSIVSDNLVGIESHIKKMSMLLNIESDDRKIVGIHGLSGIGKTTIARAVYNAVIDGFEGYRFIENIQEKAKKHGLPHLQNQLIFGILKQENLNITSVADGINMIKQRLCQRKVLIVLDDVDQDIQVESLVGDCGWFGIGSKIIITSRNEHILRKADEIYKPDVMNLDDSLKLFSHHAFGRDQPLEDYLELSTAMVETTGGLPLALKVVGSSLHSKEKSIWKDMLKKMQNVPHTDVMERLKISYDELDVEEGQQMFLDTACFFIGMKKDIACPIWDGCGFFSQVGFDGLFVRSLVTISEGELRMHNLVQDLGRQIVRRESIHEPGKRSRIWSEDEVLYVLDTKTGTDNVRGLSIDFRYKFRSKCLASEGFDMMTELRLLQVDYAYFSGNFMHSFSELRWLSWKGCPDQYALTNFRPRKLAVLDLSCSEITKNWMGWNDIKVAVNLKVLILSSCHQLLRTPDLSANQDLEVLLLNYCGNLVEIDTSIGYLKNLVILDMSHCERLVDFPIEICQLTSLEKLDLKVCTSLKKLPEKLGLLISLKTLDLSYCKGLVDLPIEICELISLESLHLNFCSNLKMLPEKLGHMISLKTLDLSYCQSLVDLPVGICQLTSLETLNLSGCESLVDLPVEIYQLTTLKTLDLSDCKSLLGLPVEICQFTSLKRLNLRGCRKLLHIPNLPSSLTLKTLDLTCCESLVDLPIGIHQLTSLERLHLWGCTELLRISNLPSSLTSLVVEFCSSIRYISDLPSSLTSLHAKHCESLEKLSSTSGLGNLERLCLDSCDRLEEIEGVDKGLDSLVLFRMLGKSLKKLPNLSNSKKLRELVIYHCLDLSKIEGLKDCESLETLTICYSMGRLPDLSNLNKLLVLTIEHCGKLTEIPGLGRLVSLQELKIERCKAIQRLPDLSNLKDLTDLKIEDCEKLTDIHGVDRLEFLKELNISGCESLERLPDLSNLKNLKELKANGCWKLTGIQAGNGLDSLELLDIGGCISLKKLPDITNLKRLPGSRFVKPETYIFRLTMILSLIQGKPQPPTHISSFNSN